MRVCVWGLCWINFALYIFIYFFLPDKLSWSEFFFFLIPTQLPFSRFIPSLCILSYLDTDLSLCFPPISFVFFEVVGCSFPPLSSLFFSPVYSLYHIHPQSNQPAPASSCSILFFFPPPRIFLFNKQTQFSFDVILFKKCLFFIFLVASSGFRKRDKGRQLGISFFGS